MNEDEDALILRVHLSNYQLFLKVVQRTHHFVQVLRNPAVEVTPANLQAWEADCLRIQPEIEAMIHELREMIARPRRPRPRPDAGQAPARCIDRGVGIE